MRLLRRADFHVGAHVNTFWRTPCRGAAEGPSKKSVVWENKHITWFGECQGGGGGAGASGQPAHRGAPYSHAGRRHRAAAAHAGEDLQTAADAPERADHHAAPPRRPQPARLPVRALLPARSVLGPRPRALPHRLPSFPGCCTWTGAPCRMP